MRLAFGVALLLVTGATARASDWAAENFAGPVPEDISVSEKGRIELVDIWGSRRWRHVDRVQCVAISPDGRRVLSGYGGGDSCLGLWDPSTGECVSSWEGHGGAVNAIAFTPDGKRALSASDDGTLVLWDVASGKPVHPRVGHRAAIYAIACSADGRWVVSGGEPDGIRRRDAATGRELAVWRGYEREVYSLAICPDGRRALSGGGDEMLRLWEVESGKILGEWKGLGGAISSVAAFADGKRAVTGSLNDKIKVWDLGTGKASPTYPKNDRQGTSVAVSSDGKRVVCGGKTPRLWDVETGREFAALTGSECHAQKVLFSPDGDAILTANYRELRVWGGLTGRWRISCSGHSEEIKGITFLTDSLHAASVADDGTLRLWDLKTAEEIDRITIDGHPQCLAAHGDRVYVGNQDATVTVYRIKP